MAHAFFHVHSLAYHDSIYLLERMVATLDASHDESSPLKTDAENAWEKKEGRTIG
jgi:hypothetical protein